MPSVGLSQVMRHQNTQTSMLSKPSKRLWSFPPAMPQNRKPGPTMHALEAQGAEHDEGLGKGDQQLVSHYCNGYNKREPLNDQCECRELCVLTPLHAAREQRADDNLLCVHLEVSSNDPQETGDRTRQERTTQ